MTARIPLDSTIDRPRPEWVQNRPNAGTPRFVQLANRPILSAARAILRPATCSAILLRSFFFHHALQRMLMFSGEIHHLGHFRLGNLICEDPTFPDPMIVNVRSEERRV